MKEYTIDTPAFSESIPVVEDGEYITAESANRSPIQLLNNDLAIRDMLLNQDVIDGAFNEVFEKSAQSDPAE